MNKRKVNQSAKELTLDEKKNLEVLNIFEQLVAYSNELLVAFETEKYRTIVIIDHEAIGTYDTLVKEIITFHFNATIGKNSNGNYSIYFSYDDEAISKFGNRLFNQMLRKLIAVSMQDTTSVNVEDRIRIDHEPKNVRNFFIKRLIDKETHHISIQAVERKTA
ncbi:MAG: hypothetical protein EOO90_21470 [Pedobacter sp.]|nr:MAG: hypothetical protein EOO90_21470 [Pedobacter sp.]